ncbi:hypothetical protein DPV78_001609 [Talaromyces pinophilus]|nr:hypothetical protein DPV78_001609 [Talaromyces pinophilus]
MSNVESHDSIPPLGDVRPAQTVRLQVYLAWVDAWVSTSNPIKANSFPPEDDSNLRPEDIFAIQLQEYFREENLPYPLNPDDLKAIIHAFCQQLRWRRIKVGGSLAPSRLETDVFYERYDDPRTKCKRTGDTQKNKEAMTDFSAWQDSECQAIRRTVTAAQTRLTDTVIERCLSSSDIQPIPDTCQGSGITNPIPEIRAPDREPNPDCDSDSTVYDSLFPAINKIKLCSDAKYFFAIACGGSLVDGGLLRAIADAGNHPLIGDYCEAADEETMNFLQQESAAAAAFLKLCSFTEYYRDHGRTNLASGIYGSHYTGLLGHRYIDVSIWVGVVSAALATGEDITNDKYLKLATVYRGKTQSFGAFVAVFATTWTRISQCLTLACAALESDRLSGMVVLGFCKWAVMASHHKVYELVNGVQEVKQYPTCKYASTEDETKYNNLLKALEPYGTLGQEGPHVYMKRATMDQLYVVDRAKSKTHIAWMADITRSHLRPEASRKIVDVVHFEWRGDVVIESFVLNFLYTIERIYRHFCDGIETSFMILESLRHRCLSYVIAIPRGRIYALFSDVAAGIV